MAVMERLSYVGRAIESGVSLAHTLNRLWRGRTKPTGKSPKLYNHSLALSFVTVAPCLLCRIDGWQQFLGQNGFVDVEVQIRASARSFQEELRWGKL